MLLFFLPTVTAAMNPFTSWVNVICPARSQPATKQLNSAPPAADNWPAVKTNAIPITIGHNRVRCTALDKRYSRCGSPQSAFATISPPQTSPIWNSVAACWQIPTTSASVRISIRLIGRRDHKAPRSADSSGLRVLIVKRYQMGSPPVTSYSRF